MIQRTALITAASIAGVVLAGGAAVGANIGILNNAASGSELGQLSAQAPPSTFETAAPITTVATLQTSTDPTSTSASADPGAGFTDFAVDTAATVSVGAIDGALQLGTVVTGPGWSWKLADTGSADGELTVVFTDGSDTLEFIAGLDGNGQVTARVERPTTVVADGTGVTATQGSAQRYDDDHDDDHDDNHHEDDHHDEHEGRDDDD